MHVRVDYPSSEEERDILRLTRGEALQEQTHSNIELLSQNAIMDLRKEVLDIHMNDNVEEYLVQLVMATRHPEKYSPQLGTWIQYGASPRATISLDRCARAHAWLNQKDFVGPDDIQAIAHDVLRHRIIISYEAEAEGIDTDQAISEILKLVPVA